jgi:NADPH:quinone reductase-like Zn-dependent oxidoreductase
MYWVGWSALMKAVVYNKNGPPDVLEMKDITKPLPKDNEVLIKVRAAAVNPLDVGVLRGLPFLARVLFGLPKPKDAPLGVDVAGQVEAVGRYVTQFKPGDAVFGLCIRDPHASAVKAWVAQGAFAEYVCAPDATIVPKPDNVTFEQAASVPVAAISALQGLRDKGHLQPSQKILINGAAGGVGTFAVQIAKSLGAEVTAVCSTRNVDMVRSIGADRVIDYTKEDFTKGAQRYDLLFDCVGNHPLPACTRILNPSGILLMVGNMTGRPIPGIVGRLLTALLLSWFSSQRLITFLAKPNKDDLIAILDLMQAGKLHPVIDRRFTLSEVREALRYQQEKHAQGKVLIAL